MAFSPDGKTLAAGYRVGVGGGGVVLWDVAARKRLAEDPLAVKEGGVTSVAFSPDGKTLAAGYGVAAAAAAGWCCGTWPRGKRLAERAARREGGRRSRAWPSAPTARPSRPDTASAASAAAGWCCGTRPARKRLADEPLAVKEGDVESVAFSPDGKTLAAGYGVGGGGGVVLWDAAARQAAGGAIRSP